MIALIDGDLAAYRAAAATQTDINWGDGEPSTIHANPEEAVKAAIYTIKLWQETAGASKVLVCLTGRGNFRKSVYPLYKSNRSDKPRPLALKAVQQAIHDEFPTAVVDGLEADDLLGLALTSPKFMGKSVCVSMDKDLRTVPGLHLNPLKGSTPEFIGEAEANRNWFTQALTGDPSDGYPGCRSIGPVKAERVLSGWCGSELLMGWGRVIETFRKFTDGHEMLGDMAALQMLRVSRILRDGDYNKATKEVRLWHPTTPESEWLKLPTV